MPGSLIFVVIVAIWAAYLLQHWVRRREEAASTRSVDGFSQAMRVLTLRGPRPAAEADPTTPATPTSSSRPPGARRSPLIARRLADRVPTTTEAQPMAETQSPAETQAASPTRETRKRTRATEPSTRSAPSAPSAPRAPRVIRPAGLLSRLGRPGRGGTDSGPRPVVSLMQRRLRAALLVASFLWVPVSVVLAAIGRLLWLSVPFAVLTFAAVLVWLRATAQADRARAAERVRELQLPGDADLTQSDLTSDDTQVIDTGTRGTQASPAAYHSDDASRPEREVALFDIEALDAPAAPAAAEPPAPGTWQPVPVPRPTYALKAKAQPRFTATGVPADVFETPEFADEAGELDERAMSARRAVGS